MVSLGGRRPHNGRLTRVDSWRTLSASRFLQAEQAPIRGGDPSSGVGSRLVVSSCSRLPELEVDTQTRGPRIGFCACVEFTK